MAGPVDCGPSDPFGLVCLIDAATGEMRRVQIFTAVVDGWNRTYDRATATQDGADRVGVIMDAHEFIGDVHSPRGFPGD